jgi:polypeptide N-acetylgalactosaminyltransferase
MGQGSSGTIGATTCHGYGGNQLIKINTKGQMTQGEWCLTPSSGWGGRVRTGYCTKGQVDGPFKYDRVRNSHWHGEGNGTGKLGRDKGLAQ